MSSKYATSHTIPEGLPKLLKDFTREVLRNQPANIYAYGAAYFKNLLEQQSMSKFEENTQIMAKLFGESDHEQTGFVPFETFKSIVYNEEVGLTERLAQMILIDVPINDEGYCNYDEFLKNSTHLLDEAEEVQPNPHPDNQPRIHIHGYLREEFEQTMAQKLTYYQTTGTGALDRKAIREALNDEDLGLRRKEINLIMGYIETEFPDGSFDCQELAHDLYELLFNAHEDNILNLPFDYTQVEDIIIRQAEENDDKDNPRKELPPLAIMSVLFNSDLGFTGLQTRALVGLLASLTQDVNYYDFARYISRWAANYQQGTYLREVGTTVIDMDHDTLQQRLRTEFVKLDEKESGNLPFEKISEVISSFPFSPRERSAVLTFALTDQPEEDGVPYQPVVDNAFNVCITQTLLGLDLVEDTAGVEDAGEMEDAA